MLAALLALSTVLFAQNTQALNSTITLRQTSGTILEFLEEINRAHGVKFAYDEKIIPNQRYSLHKTHWKLDDFLQKLLQKAGLKFEQAAG